jgi:SET domain-containing protein
VNILYQRKRKLFVGKSKVCPSLGLFAGEIIEKEEYICLYSGEILTENDSENRGVVQDVIEETYLFTLNNRYVIDASKVGNIMRYSNHGSGNHTNAVPKIITYVEGNQTIGLYATKRINIGQEILFDYNFAKDFDWLKDYQHKYGPHKD